MAKAKTAPKREAKRKFTTDPEGFVTITGMTEPMYFEDQKAAAKWILGPGKDALGEGVALEVANHPQGWGFGIAAFAAQPDIPDSLKAKEKPAKGAKAEELEDWETDPEPLKLEGLRWVRLYYYGMAMKDRETNRPMSIGVLSDAPVTGWSGAYIVPGDKRSTIFCPYTFKAFSVPNDCVELKHSADSPFDGEYHRGLLKRGYDKFSREGGLGDLDVAAVVMTKLGMPVPVIKRAEPSATTAAGTERKTKVGGKPIIPENLKQLKPTGKRADVARKFLSDAPVPIRAVMAELGMDRNGVLSHLFYINRDCGLGYELGNDCARILVPKDHVVFAEPGAETAKVRAEVEYKEGEYAIKKGGTGSFHVLKGGKDQKQDFESLKLARAWCKRQAKPETEKPKKEDKPKADKKAKPKAEKKAKPKAAPKKKKADVEEDW